MCNALKISRSIVHNSGLTKGHTHTHDLTGFFDANDMTVRCFNLVTCACESDGKMATLSAGTHITDIKT